LKVRLIDPAPKDSILRQTAKDIKSYWFARLSLTTIAALTPPEIEVAITEPMKLQTVSEQEVLPL